MQCTDTKVLDGLRLFIQQTKNVVQTNIFVIKKVVGCYTRLIFCRLDDPPTPNKINTIMYLLQFL